MARLKKSNTKIVFETGFMNDTLVLKLNPPVLETEERIIKEHRHCIKAKALYKRRGNTLYHRWQHAG